MKKLSVLTLVIFLGAVSLAMAEMAKAGNTVCPVSGDKVSGKDFVMHEGKKISLCCKHCEKEFKKDPAKFVTQLETKDGHEGHSH